MKIKHLFLPLFTLMCLFGLNSKNIVKTPINEVKSPVISRVFRSNSADSFIDYWQNDFRVHNPAVCDIKYDAYKEMYDRYLLLSNEDRTIVNAVKDNLEPEYTIGAIVKVLVNRFYPNNNKIKNEKQKLDQTSIIVIATVVALVGATSISILFILKNNKVIK